MDWAITEKSYTQRKACDLVGLEPKVYRDTSVRPDDTDMRQRLQELARSAGGMAPPPAPASGA